jgi:glutathione S-transferase
MVGSRRTTTESELYTLYYAPGACSLAPHIALREADLPFQMKKVSTKTKEMEDGGDYRTVNPLGYVPALALPDGTLMTEAPVILQYVADQAPDKALVPAQGTRERYTVQSLLNFVGTELHKSFSPLFNPNLGDDAKSVFRTRLVDRFKWVNEQLAGRQWFSGERFGVADAYLFAVSNWAKPMGVDLTGLDALLAWRKRAGERPAVQAALQAEGLAK